MTNARLVEDMATLAGQVQACSNTAKWVAVRLFGLENVVMEDNETTFDQLQTRIKRTVEFLEKVDPQSIEGKEHKEVLMETKMGKFKMPTAEAYVSDFAVPNFHFHLSTGYCILKRLGVPIGAFDYLGKTTFTKVE